MSGWIKWEKDLENDPRVLRMLRELKRLCNAPALPDRTYVTLLCGGLLRFWAYADSHIREDDTLDLSAAEIDEFIGIEGLCSVMPVDWLIQVDEKTVQLPNFQAHNGVEARKKALTQKRVETHRKRTSVTPALTTALPDLDQTKTRPKKKVAEATPAIEFDPKTIPGLNLEAWSRWFSHRKASGKPIKPHSLEAAAQELAKLGDRQAGEVQRAVAGGWQGLHPEQINGRAAADPPRARAFPS